MIDNKIKCLKNKNKNNCIAHKFQYFCCKILNIDPFSMIDQESRYLEAMRADWENGARQSAEAAERGPGIDQLQIYGLPAGGGAEGWTALCRPPRPPRSPCPPTYLLRPPSGRLDKAALITKER